MVCAGGNILPVYHLIHYNFFGLLQKTRHNEAESWFVKAGKLAPRDPAVHLHYGLFLMDADRNSQAAEEFAKAAEIDPQDYESIFNAGVAFRQAGQHSQAEEFYRKAVDLKPNVSVFFSFPISDPLFFLPQSSSLAWLGTYAY